MFEALFILTLLETGTRVARFILQDVLAHFCREAERRPRTVLDPERGRQPGRLRAVGILALRFEIGRLWLMMGIANQLLAAIGLAVGTTYLLQHSPKRVYALCTGIPFVVVAVTVFTAGVESVHLWWLQQAAPDSPPPTASPTG